MEYGKIETLYERNLSTFKVRVGGSKNRTYNLLKTWHWTEKVDGTNIRCIWKDGRLTFGGKTNNALLPADLVKWLYENVSTDKLREVFPGEEGKPANVVIYGEGYGAGIQKGGGDYSPVKKIIVFNVLVGSKWWLSYRTSATWRRSLVLR